MENQMKIKMKMKCKKCQVNGIQFKISKR